MHCFGFRVYQYSHDSGEATGFPTSEKSSKNPDRAGGRMFCGNHGKIRNEYFALALAGSYWIVLSWASLIGKSRQWPMKVCKTRSWFQHISTHSYFCDLFWDWLTLTSWYFQIGGHGQLRTIESVTWCSSRSAEPLHKGKTTALLAITY